jgi:hypothetical protein
MLFWNISILSIFQTFAIFSSQKKNVNRSEKNQFHVKISFPAYPDDCSYLDHRSCKRIKANQLDDLVMKLEF